jgi:spermidine synthase
VIGLNSGAHAVGYVGLRADVVEISEAVVQQAARYFQYERCASADRQGDQVAITTAAACPRGETFVMDGLVFLEGEPEETYDLFVVDVYTGWNPFMFFEREVVARVRDRWLARDGVLVLNFVGYFNGPHIAAPRSIYRTLRTLFAHVKCFRCGFPPSLASCPSVVVS